MKEFLADLYNFLHYKSNIFKLSRLLFPRKKKEVSLPADDGFLDKEDIQWWYWTGHLTGEKGEKFGFEVVFFAFDSWIFFRNILAQAAVSDISGNSYSFGEKVEFLKLPKKLRAAFDLDAKEPREGIVISAKGGNGRDDLYFKTGDYEATLRLEEQSNPVVHYGGKLHKYEFGGDTFYYAREMMKTTGVIKKNGVEYKVGGVSWFDRQYGELYRAIFKGWQWFAIELYTGEAIMLYDFRDDKYAAERFGSITRENRTRNITYGDFAVEILSTWKSPHTGVIYPSKWKVKAEKNTYIIVPAVADQELRAKHHIWIGPEYWEGACAVYNESGSEIGRAYVELNGYGRDKIITV